MKFFLRKIIPRLASIIALLVVKFIPALEGAEEAVTTAILGVWGVIEIGLAKNDSERQGLIQADQRMLAAEGVYHGDFDGKYGPKNSAAVRAAAARHGGPAK